MNINKYTEKAREAVAAAHRARASRANNPQIEPEHLLVALVEQRDGIVPELLRKMNADPAAIARARRASCSKKLPQAYGGAAAGHVAAAASWSPIRPQAEAERLKDEFVSTEHLLHRDRRRRRAAPPPRSC